MEPDGILIDIYIPVTIGREITRLRGAKRLDRQRGDLPERWVFRWVYLYFWAGNALCLIEGEEATLEKILALVGHSLAEFRT